MPNDQASGVDVPRAVLWLTGRDLLKPEPELLNGVQWRSVGPPEPKWELTFSADAYLKLFLPSGPNVMHRVMQRITLGFRWRMLPRDLTQS